MADLRLGSTVDPAGEPLSVDSAERRRTAEEKAVRARDDLLEIEQEILDEVQEIDARWREVGAAIEAVAIRPESTDVAIDRLTVVWVPQP